MKMRKINTLRVSVATFEGGEIVEMGKFKASQGIP